MLCSRGWPVGLRQRWAAVLRANLQGDDMAWEKAAAGAELRQGEEGGGDLGAISGKGRRAAWRWLGLAQGARGCCAGLKRGDLCARRQGGRAANRGWRCSQETEGAGCAGLPVLPRGCCWRPAKAAVDGWACQGKVVLGHGGGGALPRAGGDGG